MEVIPSEAALPRSEGSPCTEVSQRLRRRPSPWAKTQSGGHPESPRSASRAEGSPGKRTSQASGKLAPD